MITILKSSHQVIQKKSYARSIVLNGKSKDPSHQEQQYRYYCYRYPFLDPLSYHPIPSIREYK